MPQRSPNMMRAKPLPSKQALVLALGLAALDQLSKIAIVFWAGFATHETRHILPFLDFTLIWNTGISYGILEGSGEAGRWLLSAVAVFAIGLFLWFLKAGETRLTGMAYGLLAGGALGNLVDRLWYGAVVDFISLHWAGFYWYVFNPADVWITLGVALLVVQIWLDRKKPQEDAAQ